MNIALSVLAIICILLQQSFQTFFELDGFSLFKVMLVFLLWLSVLCWALIAIKNRSGVTLAFSKMRYLIYLLLIWNGLCILRSLIFDSVSIITLFGNVYTALALIAPISIFAVINQCNYYSVISFQLKYLKLLPAVIGLFLVFGLIYQSSPFTKLSLVLLMPLSVLIAVTPYLNRGMKVLVFLCCLLLFYIAEVQSVRTDILRLFLLVFLIGLLPANDKQIMRLFLFKFVCIFLLTLPLFGFIHAELENSSPFSFISNFTSDEVVAQDTRTFLYEEVFQDLNSLEVAFGRGAAGTYYSEYFDTAEGDSEIRLSVEVGVLSIILKSGLLGLLLQLMILIASIKLALFNSNNLLVKALGGVLVVHVLLLFVENVMVYSFNNVFVWIFCGLCLSFQFREMNDLELKQAWRKNESFS